jgi:hypothetical protein
MKNTALNTTSLTTGIIFPYYLISFFEGGILMGVEILSAKLIAPYYGTSVYVWAAILSTTLLGLAIGYHYGGILSARNDAGRILSRVVVLSIIFLLVLFIWSDFLLESTLALSLEIGVVVSAILLLLPLMICFGLVSPLIINLTSRGSDNAGKTSGNVYALSTVGGILFALLTGLYLLTDVGIQFTILLFAILYTLVGLIAFVSLRLDSRSKFPPPE